MTEQPTNGPPAETQQDHRTRQVELAISNILRGGVIVSIVLIVLGTIVTFARHPTYVTQPSELHPLITPGTHFPHDLHNVVKELAVGRGKAIVTLGLIVLIATPVLRVAVSIVAFIYEGDRVFMLITATVLCLLLLSFLLGAVE